jgi:hypothetical protein
LLSLVGLACGKVAGDGSSSAAGSNSGGARSRPDGAAGDDLAGAGSDVGGAAGNVELSHVDLTGAPIYTRFQRLTNAQWENAVTDILNFQKRHDLSAAFTAPPTGVTAFDNNEQLLFVDQQRFTEFESGAEAAAAAATGSVEAITALYSGNDAASFVRFLGRRAFRRPLTADEETKYQKVFALGESLYGTGFSNGAALVIRALLESPHFLYRTELGPAGEPLNPYELASKLSFWLLGTTPSDALLNVAASGKLTSDDDLEASARQMLEDPRAVAVMRDFHDQLLHVAELSNIRKTDEPDYNTSLNSELTVAANAFFDFIFKQNLGLHELLTSSQAYVSPGLAPFYGVAAPTALELRDLGPARAGYFMQVPYLMLWSTNSETNPIQRGSRLEAALLCGPIAPHPASPNIPPLPGLATGQSNRQRVTEATAGCGGTCHGYIDPLGFAFEDFDGLGRKRRLDNLVAIDTSGSYPLAEGVARFTDAKTLMAVLANSAQVQTCYSKQITSYALGRDLVESDRSLLEALGKVSGSQSLKELIVALVRDPAFRTRKGDTP